MTQFNATTYDIERPTGVCAYTGRPLQPGDKYVATLVEYDPASVLQGEQPKPAAGALGLKRSDVSLEAWEAGQRPDGMFSYWLTTVAEPNAKKRMFVDDGVLLNLFRRLADTDQAERVRFRFVLGLILMRKKMLRYDGSEMRTVDNDVLHDGESQGPRKLEYWKFTPKLDPAKGPMGKWNEQDPLEMVNPQLTDDQVVQVTEQLSEILEAEL
jgi:hypothetical protein